MFRALDGARDRCYDGAACVRGGQAPLGSRSHKTVLEVPQMRRSVVRMAGILILILSMALGTAAAPVFAGELGGGSDALISALLVAPKGSCAYIQNADTGTFFLARK